MRAILAHHVWRGHDSLPSPNGFERFGRMQRPLRHTRIRNRRGPRQNTEIATSATLKSSVLWERILYLRMLKAHTECMVFMFFNRLN